MTFKAFTTLSFVIVLLTTFSCRTKKETAQTVVSVTPDWVMQRPNSTTFYYGIGSAKIFGPPELYKEKARKNALADIASQVSSKVSSVSVLYQIEDKKKVSEILQNHIESESNEFLEGYTLVGTYSDEFNYYECYKLSKEEFALLKEKRKNEALNQALQLYQEAGKIADKGAFMQKVTAYAKVLERLEGYLADNTTVTSENKEINLSGNSLQSISNLLDKLSIKAKKDTISAKAGNTITETQLTCMVTTQGVSEPQIPVKFELTSNYLRKDKTYTSEAGTATTEVQKFFSNKPWELFTAAIDNEMIVRTATKNISVRLLLSNIKIQKRCDVVVLVEK